MLQRNNNDCGAWVVVFLNLLLEGQADKIKDLSPSFLTSCQVREQIAIFLIRGSLDDFPPLKWDKLSFHKIVRYNDDECSDLPQVTRAVQTIQNTEIELTEKEKKFKSEISGE